MRIVFDILRFKYDFDRHSPKRYFIERMEKLQRYVKSKSVNNLDDASVEPRPVQN